MSSNNPQTTITTADISTTTSKPQTTTPVEMSPTTKKPLTTTPVEMASTTTGIVISQKPVDITDITPSGFTSTKKPLKNTVTTPT